MNHMMRMFDRTGHSEGSTQQNSFHEISLQSQHDYDIYADDFFLKVNWTLPDGSVRESDGFYDGSRDYRARAYTHQVGQWSWRIESSIAEFNGLNGNFGVAASTLPGKLCKHRDDPFQFQYDKTETGFYILVIRHTATLIFRNPTGSPTLSRPMTLALQRYALGLIMGATTYRNYSPKAARH